MELTPFLSSLFILVREGFEAILIATLIFVYLDRMKARHKRPAVFWGMGAGVIASLFIAIGFKEIAVLTKAHQEVFEGATMLLASGMLAYVAFFCHNAKQHVEGKIDKAISNGNSLVLSFTVFVAILREGFEIVLFYSALIGSALYNATPVLIGAGVGLTALIIVYFGLNRVVKFIPLGTFFRASSVLLAVLAIYFAYEGVFELREGLEHLA